MTVSYVWRVKVKSLHKDREVTYYNIPYYIDGEDIDTPVLDEYQTVKEALDDKQDFDDIFGPGTTKDWVLCIMKIEEVEEEEIL